MTHEKALTLSLSLAALGVSHTVAIGYHAQLTQPVQAHVTVQLMELRRERDLAGAIRILAEIAEEHGLRLTTSMLSNAIEFADPLPPGHEVT